MLRIFFLFPITRRIKIKHLFIKKIAEAKSERERKKIVWKFKRNISFCFDSAILLSFKQIIIQTQGRRKIIMKAENIQQKKTLLVKKERKNKLQQHKHCTEGNNELEKYSMRSRRKI